MPHNGVVLSGPYKTLRASAVFAANATWYATTNTVIPGPGANGMEIYAESATASPGNVDFYITRIPMGGETKAYTNAVASEGPEIYGSIPFTAANQNFVINVGPVAPSDTVQVYYRASAGAASAKLAIKCRPIFDPSGTNNIEASVGDIEVDVEAMEVLLTSIETLMEGGGVTGSGYKTYLDAAFVTGSTGVVHDVNTDLARNGNAGFIDNYGAGSLSIQISNSGAVVAQSSILINAGDVFSLDNLNADQIKITWIADTSYQVFIR